MTYTTKYNRGDTVWRVDGNGKLQRSTITEIAINHDKRDHTSIRYNYKEWHPDQWDYEDQVFESPEAAAAKIRAQAEETIKKMMEMIKPITPDEVVAERRTDIPDVVFKAFNTLISQNWNGNDSTFRMDEAFAFCAREGLNSSTIEVNGYFDIEGHYGDAGWAVLYDGPGYNETYPATFKFMRKKNAK